MTIGHFFGLDSVSDNQYATFSGAGSIFIPYLLQVLTFVPIYFYHHNCHYKGCPRIGKHQHKHFKYCRKHHPLIKES